METHKKLSLDDIVTVLGLTIKRDEYNKLLTFLGLLSAYTESSQINISFNAPSSSGKSFIPTEIARLFPKEDVIEVAYCSPTAFFHDVGKFDKEKQGYIVNLSHKILIFLDQPNPLLLQHLRPLLSHDKKEIQLKITDKSQKAGLRTKNVYLIGYPAVIFCTAGLRIDEQEATRFLLLSPEINQEKIREAITAKIQRESYQSFYDNNVITDPEREALMERVMDIKKSNIEEIRISNSKKVHEMFFKRVTIFKPRHQRDISRLMALIKVIALLNLWDKKRFENAIYADDTDIETAFDLWDSISESQELNLPPYIYSLYNEVIIPAFNEKNSVITGGVNIGVTRQDIIKHHFTVYGRHLPEIQLRQQILPMLNASGLINEEPDELDKRRILIYPTTLLTISGGDGNSNEPEMLSNDLEETMEKLGLDKS